MGKATTKFKVGIIGLGMGRAWAEAVGANSSAKLSVVYDQNPGVARTVARRFSAAAARSEREFFDAPVDMVIVATPDHWHVRHSLAALAGGKHVICEKPLAPSVRECRKIIDAVEKHRQFFMVGQVCRYAPGFKSARKLIADGIIGDIVFIESEYAHDYARLPGADNWRKDPRIKRQGFLGGGCHALDLIRWLTGREPMEVFCYTNRKLLPDWPADDTGIAVFKFADNLIGKVLVSIGAKRAYTMRTVVYGSAGTIICDNTSPTIRLYRERRRRGGGSNRFRDIPVDIASHNVAAEFSEFVESVRKNRQTPTDVYEGTRTVAFAEAALKSARTGRPARIEAIV